jgi:hypothetical protein
MNSIKPINSINVPSGPDALSQFASLTLWAHDFEKFLQYLGKFIGEEIGL